MQGLNPILKKRITIRRFRLPDIERVLRTERRSFTLPWRFQDFLLLNLDGKNLFFVAVKDEVIGYAIAELTKGTSHSKTKIQGHLLNIAVDLNHRNQGVGRKLLNSIFEKLKENGAERVWLEVRISNNSARNFYKKLGFKEGKILPDYYRDEGAIVMKIELL